MTKFPFQDDVLESGWKSIREYWGKCLAQGESLPSGSLFAGGPTCPQGRAATSGRSAGICHSSKLGEGASAQLMEGHEELLALLASLRYMGTPRWLRPG